MTNAPDQPVVRFTGVGFTYPGPPAVTALHPCDLTVGRNEYVAIVGPSGSGKSTFLNVVGLLDRPTVGRYEIDGIDVSTLREADRAALRGRKIGFVFQAFHLMPYRTALENASMTGLYDGVPLRRRRQRAHDALRRVGLSHRLHALPGTLSGGERQRVALARALSGEPSLLLCDEPTGNLDTTTTSEVLDMLDEVHASGLTVLVITHDPQVSGRADRVITICDGRLSESPPTADGA